VAAAVVLLSVAAVWLTGAAHNDGSALSLGPHGWMGARRYLEARGAQVTLLDGPLRDAQVSGLLAVVFPWQRVADLHGASDLRLHLQRGGQVLVAYSGALGDVGEAELFDQLGVSLRQYGGEPPLHPLAFWRHASRRLTLMPEEGAPTRALEIPLPARVPDAPASAGVLYRDRGGLPFVFEIAQGSGRVLVLPATLFANGGLERAANADLLEAVLADYGPEWTFDEYHHGFAAVPPPEVRERQWVTDLVLLRLALAYLLALAALARRFGPPWRETPSLAGSACAMLLGLGRVHDRLGHHADAAARLVARARELDPRLVVGPGLERDAAGADAAGLVKVARALARAQERRRG
jgi:hypothetical protein